ncbi:oligosaccharyl transferase, archaeosortase A system-associated [Natronosalvus amylolyticus]|uniref:oligosaccharyl transferase, archaeosortase A system-associated n=1 Tax=Natronosalvus amylolyticus TaxID=2961994 RepID=UPI0020C99446|nr:oligosaccharyl transferase, archaeosortase A system-associated [Natronosalvus amylolyticus]
MSTETERIGEDTTESTLEAVQRWYHVPIIAVAMAFMFWVRMQEYSEVAMRDGQARLSAVDSWYHWRSVQWTAENYPYTMPYEIWTSFPTGQYVGQFGTLFDQILVTVAFIVGLGDPSTHQLYTVAIVMVPVLAALVAIPVYFIGRRLGGQIGGLVSVILLALAPGQFLSRTTVGQLQHHVAEVLFMAIAILAMMAALRVAEREQPIWELVLDGDWDGLREPALYSALTGVALSLYLWSWPPGVVLLGILGVFFVVQLSLDFVRGRSPDHVAFVGIVSMVIPGAFMLLMLEVWTFSSVTSFGLLQPTVAFLVGAGCVFMAWLARQWEGHGLERQYYPVAIAGSIIGSLIVMSLVLPDLYSTLIGNLTGRLIPINVSETALTVSEAQPPDNFGQHVFNEFGAAFFTMLGGLAFLLLRPLFGREFRAEHTLIIVWALFLTSMAATQIRFAYYLVLAVAVLNAVFVADIARLLNLDFQRSAQSIRDVETYQVIAIFLVVMMLFMPLLPPIAAQGSTAWERGAQAGPSGDAMVWQESTDWMLESTPEPGNWAGAGHQDDLEYYGTYEYPEGGDYDYPEGAYGVMSWWDYGHLITTNAERMPHSNPFQSNARSSSWYLQAGDEAHGEAILDGISAGVSVTDRSADEIRSDIDEPGHEDVQYVMIDDQMAGGKFSAIATWSGPGMSAYETAEPVSVMGTEIEATTTNEAYEDTMLASLYLEDAEGMEHYRLVHESSTYSIVGSQILVLPDGQAVDISTGSERFAAGGYTDAVAEAEQQFEMAEATDQALLLNSQYPFQGFMTQQYVHNAQVVSAVKTFERVEGATITGSAPGVADGETVYAQVELETEPGRTFTYTQQATVENEAFELTVPYATDNELGPEDGYSDSAVEALDDEYTIFVGSPEDGEIEREYITTTDVSELAVVEGETLEVTLEEGDGEVVPDPDAEPDFDGEAVEGEEVDDEDVDDEEIEDE